MEQVIQTSFFDQKNYLTNEEEKKLCYVRPEKSFWIKNKGDEIDLDDIFSYVNDDILQEGYVMRRSLKTKKEKTHYYRLYKDRLERYADNTTDFASKILVLRGVKCEMLNIKDNKDFEETQDKFLLVFTLNQKFTILYLNIEKQFDEWSLAFRKTCILGYFGKFYKNRKVIGRGTFAKVLLSRNLANNHEYAVKTFDKKNLLSDQTTNKARIGLINEIHLMMMLDNPNIIKLYEVYEGEYHIYLVMELLNGGELFDRIMNKGHYAERDAGILISKLLSALVYLHSMNIMHRDIKPENLILKDEDGFDLKLADFGLAEFANQRNHLFRRCGTPGYVAPEILDDQPYDCKVDVFSAGVILYILLTGCSPFYGETYNEILIKNKKCKVNFDLEELKVDVSDQAIDLLRRMLEKNPKKRITAKECLKHEWISGNCRLKDQIIEQNSPYKNKRESLAYNYQRNIQVSTDPTIHSIKDNLTQFNTTNKHLTEQSKKPSNLIISNQMKYDVNQDLNQEDSPMNSPELKKRDKNKKLPKKYTQVQKPQRSKSQKKE